MKIEFTLKIIYANQASVVSRLRTTGAGAWSIT